LKIQLSQQTILLIFVTIALICRLAVSDSLAAHEAVILSTLSRNISGVNKVPAGTNTKINRKPLLSEFKIMSSVSSESRNQNSIEIQMAMEAKKDLARRLSVKVDQINLREVRKVKWPDASLGCPKAGKVYNQVPQNGFLIRLEVGRHMYFYHSAGTQKPFLCEETSQIVPQPTKGEEFVPPPGSEID
jgi:hypothetical protein